MREEHGRSVHTRQRHRPTGTRCHITPRRMRTRQRAKIWGANHNHSIHSRRCAARLPVAAGGAMSNPTHPNTLAARTHLRHKRSAASRAGARSVRWKLMKPTSTQSIAHPHRRQTRLPRTLFWVGACAETATAAWKPEAASSIIIPQMGEKIIGRIWAPSPIIMTEFEPGKSDPFQEVSHGHLW